MAKQKPQVLTGIEIGTSTIKVVMGAVLPDDEISIVGSAEIPSLKVVKGEVVDADVVQEQLERALAAAERDSGMEIGPTFLAVSGAHIRTVNSVGSTMITSPGRKIMENDIVTAGRNAHACTLPPDRKVLHYFDRSYWVDGSREVVNPQGLVGTKLEADVHIVFGQHNRLETNCRMVADVMSYPAMDVAFSPVAAGYATFSTEEAEKGGLLIDIGAGVTEYIVFHGPGCCHSGQLTVGCDHITNDLAIGLRLPSARCRKILHDLGDFGSSVMNPDGRSRLMAVDNLTQGVRHIPISTIEQIIELRVQELFETILRDLEKHNAMRRVACGVRLSGGGAYIPDIDRLAQHIFKMPVTIAKPHLLSGEQDVLNCPRFITALGLVRWGKLMLDIGDPQPAPVWRQFRLDAQKAWQVLRRSFRW